MVVPALPELIASLAYGGVEVAPIITVFVEVASTTEELAITPVHPPALVSPPALTTEQRTLPRELVWSAEEPLQVAAPPRAVAEKMSPLPEALAAPMPSPPVIYVSPDTERVRAGEVVPMPTLPLLVTTVKPVPTEAELV